MMVSLTSVHSYTNCPPDRTNLKPNFDALSERTLRKHSLYLWYHSGADHASFGPNLAGLLPDTCHHSKVMWEV